MSKYIIKIETKTGLRFQVLVDNEAELQNYLESRKQSTSVKSIEVFKEIEDLKWTSPE